MKINEVTNNQRLDEFWPQVVAGATAIGKVASKFLGKGGDKTSKIAKSDKADFDQLPLSKKVTGKVHGDPKIGNTTKWKKDSNIDKQFTPDLSKGTVKAINRKNNFPKE